MNTKSLKLNGLISIINKIISMACSLILPRLFILSFGSEITGLMSSITQYLSLISLLDLGMGAVLQASMYKPLVENDTNTLSTIYYKSQQFFYRIGLALLLYIIILCLLLPQILSGNFSIKQIVSLILILSLSQLLQFFIGITSQIILGSDQKAYIKELLQGLANIANLLLSIFLIHLNQSIYLVKFTTALVYVVPPIIISIYVHKHYHISKQNIDKGYKIKQQWYGIGQHIAYTIQESTDIVILSLLTTLSSVSVYVVYNTVFQGIKVFLNAITSGLRPYLGKSLHAEDRETISRQFNQIEWKIHTVSTIILSTTFQLVTPFVILYTRNIKDANYNQPIFGYMMTLSILFYALRLPYRTLVFAKGDFKNTQVGTYLEAIINLVISFSLVFQLRLIGVAIGTLISLLFSLIYYTWYCYKFLLKISLKRALYLYTSDLLVFTLSSIIFIQLISDIHNFWSWAIWGIISVSITTLISFLANKIFFKKSPPSISGMFKKK